MEPGTRCQLVAGGLVLLGERVWDGLDPDQVDDDVAEGRADVAVADARREAQLALVLGGQELGVPKGGTYVAPLWGKGWHPPPIPPLPEPAAADMDKP